MLIDVGNNCLTDNPQNKEVTILPSKNIINTIDLHNLIIMPNGNRHALRCLFLSLAYAAQINPCDFYQNIVNLVATNDGDGSKDYKQFKKETLTNSNVDISVLLTNINVRSLFPNGLIVVMITYTSKWVFDTSDTQNLQHSFYFNPLKGNISENTPIIFNENQIHFIVSAEGNREISNLITSQSLSIRDYDDLQNMATIVYPLNQTEIDALNTKAIPILQFSIILVKN